MLHFLLADKKCKLYLFRILLKPFHCVGCHQQNGRVFLLLQMPEENDLIDNKPNYFSIIPADVRYSKLICDGAKILYSEISALCNKDGYCWASNAYFAKVFEKDANTVSRWIKELIDNGFVNSLIDRLAGNKRRLYLSLKVQVPILKIGDTPIPKNGVYNNTSTNNKKNVIRSVDLELDLKNRKDNFFTHLTKFKTDNPSKYPFQVYEKFFSYWTEKNELDEGVKMRFEQQGFFEIGKRLTTWWKNVKDVERKEMWELHHLKFPSNSTDLFSNVFVNKV